ISEGYGMKKFARQRFGARRSHQDAQQRYRDQDEANHICQVNVRVPEGWSANIKKFAQLLREGITPEAALMEAFRMGATAVHAKSAVTTTGDDRRDFP
ncbi:MAG: hypothetical protein QOG73_2674, partial [Acetobacteraceae bacterium]|nr:hypothetical protein [Acetobacteraceae bacterium]